jgi:hypothetical protein
LGQFSQPPNNEADCEGLNQLVEDGTCADLAVTFVQSLAYHEGSAARAAWFLEIARCLDDVYMPPDHPVIQGMLSNSKLLADAALVVRR